MFFFLRFLKITLCHNKRIISKSRSTIDCRRSTEEKLIIGFHFSRSVIFHLVFDRFASCIINAQPRPRSVPVLDRRPVLPGVFNIPGKALRQMAEHLTVLKANGDKVSAQEIENALEKLWGLSALLEDHEGELALRLHSAAGNNPKLLELLPDSPALRKMPVLQHLTKIIPVLSLELTNGLQQLAAQENMLVTEEQEQLAQQQEEAARLADLQAEEEDAQEELHYQDLEEKLRKNAADREKQEQDRRGGTGCRGDPDSVRELRKQASEEGIGIKNH